MVGLLAWSKVSTSFWEQPWSRNLALSASKPSDAASPGLDEVDDPERVGLPITVEEADPMCSTVGG